ncbi:recombinase family protein, partial [Chelatococcus daeguensis]|uniref:recombinase family protein n=1 Tax=Chelatococcus daeguensis TaxID=444444 RepID=UPI0007B2A055
MKQRAALYARFSTAHQNERSVNDQLALCRDFAARNGFAVVAEYADRAKSGGTIFGREGLLDLMARAERRDFDVVVVEALDRVSRDMEDMAAIHKRLRFAGIRLIAVNDGEASTMLVGLRGLVGQLYREDGAEKVRRGMAGVVRSGRSAGGRSYGYRPVLGKPGELEIVPDEAAVVLRIFEDYVGGMSPRDIAHRLNREGVAPPRGAKWNASTINGNLARGHGMILNPLFAGRIVWNRTVMVRDPDTGRRVPRPRPESEWQSVDAPHLRIVPQDLWEAAQDRKHGRSRGAGRTLVRTKRLLSGLIRCGHCGGGMSIASKARGRQRIACSRARESGTCQNTKKVFLDAIEETVIEGLRVQLSDPQRLAQYVQEYRERRRAEAAAATRERTAVERRLAEVTAAMDRIVSSIGAGILTTEEARGQMAQLRQEKAVLEERLDVAMRELTIVELHPEAVEAYRKAVQSLSTVLRDAIEDEDQDVIAAFRALVDSVVITPGARYEAPIVEIRGRLAALTGAPIAPSGRYRRAGVALEVVAEE